jgi:hypothetical protein
MTQYAFSDLIRVAFGVVGLVILVMVARIPIKLRGRTDLPRGNRLLLMWLTVLGLAMAAFGLARALPLVWSLLRP